jgi:hypothetical protein
MAPLGAKGIEICTEEKEQEGHVAENEFLQQEWEGRLASTSAYTLICVVKIIIIMSDISPPPLCYLTLPFLSLVCH